MVNSLNPMAAAHLLGVAAAAAAQARTLAAYLLPVGMVEMALIVVAVMLWQQMGVFRVVVAAAQDQTARLHLLKAALAQTA
nr:hypothetical protein [uncultured Halomonas sp.]